MFFLQQNNIFYLRLHSPHQLINQTVVHFQVPFWQSGFHVCLGQVLFKQQRSWPCIKWFNNPRDLTKFCQLLQAPFGRLLAHEGIPHLSQLPCFVWSNFSPIPWRILWPYVRVNHFIVDWKHRRTRRWSQQMSWQGEKILFPKGHRLPTGERHLERKSHDRHQITWCWTWRKERCCVAECQSNKKSGFCSFSNCEFSWQPEKMRCDVVVFGIVE